MKEVLNSPYFPNDMCSYYYTQLIDLLSRSGVLLSKLKGNNVHIHDRKLEFHLKGHCSCDIARGSLQGEPR
jgi:hypothetical protein